MDTPSPIHISIVIPAYKRQDSVLKLLEDLSHQTFKAFEIIVVEDRGDDGTPEAIASRFPEVQCLVNEVNSGPAVSRNRGIRIAKGDIIVGFDSDVAVPDPTLLERVVTSFVQHPKTAGFAFRLFQPDGKSDDIARWWHPLPVTTSSTRTFETNYFSGTAYAFRKHPILKAGLYPEILYMHYEEVVLALRLISYGHHLLYDPSLTVVHNEGQISRRTEIKTFYKTRNQILLTILCYPPAKGLFYLTPRLIFGLCSSIRNHHLASYIKAIISAIFLTRECIQQRSPLTKAALSRIRLLSLGIIPK